MSGYWDTHCHLTMDAYQSDLDAVLTSSREQNVQAILVPGIDLQSSRQAVKLANQYECMVASVGIHPHDAKSWRSDHADQLRMLTEHSSVVAIGEIGLDFYRNYSPAALQFDVFEKQLTLAVELDLPVILHERESAEEMWPFLEKTAAEFHRIGRVCWGVLHSFSGSKEYALRAVELGLLIGISGPLTYKNAVMKKQMTAELSLEKMLLETDGPYLTPVPHRGKRNLPEYIPLIAAEIAALKHVPLEKVRDVTTQNAKSLFNWRSTL